MRLILAAVGQSLLIVGASVLHAVWRLDGIIWLIRCGLPRGRYVALVLKHFGATISDDCDLESGLTIHHAHSNFSNLVIGSGAHIGKEVFLDLADRIVICDRAVVSMRTVILTHLDVGRSPLSSKYPTVSGPVTVESGAYIGAGAILLHGVTVGAESLVAAGAVVTRDVAPHSLVAGVPAQPVKTVGLKDKT